MTAGIGRTAPGTTKPQEGRRVPFVAWVGVVAAAGLLFGHIWWYRFLCDDAFISFRYARNLSEGYGLVFNPGFERVEGYTNFLWVILLAGLNGLGWLPERAAPVLGTLCGLILWGLCVRYCLGHPPQVRRRAWLLLIVPVFVAANRSYAVWCTSGLETKLFELLVVAGVLRTVSEIERARDASRSPWPLGAALLSLACLTRPDGVLIFVCVLTARVLIEWRARMIRPAPLAGAILIFALLVGGHLIFRLAYYGEWLPNTYYAKVGGQTWWSMGGKYLAAFTIEYAVWLWAPLILLGAWAAIRRGRPALPLLIGAVVIPHAVYVAAIGGDHFEYRPIDLYFPLLFILLYHGAEYLARSRISAGLTAAYLVLSLAASALFPTLTRLSAPQTYVVGFPGSNARPDGSRDAISRARFGWVFRAPLLGRLAEAHNRLAIETSRHFVALRQPEHKMFLGRVAAEGHRIADAIHSGLLAFDLHLAIDCVGAIPYYSRLRTLDRLGLTDKNVARGQMFRPEDRSMAHDKIASLAYGRQAGVDVWALDGENFLLPIDHPTILYYTQICEARGVQLIGRRLNDDEWATGIDPHGQARFTGRLQGWRTIRSGFLAEMYAEREGDEAHPRAREYERLHLYFGALLQRRGLLAEATRHYQRAVDYHPASHTSHSLLGVARMSLGHYGDALESLNRAVELAPDDLEAANNLAWLLATCPDPSVRDGTRAVRLAEAVVKQTGGGEPTVLDTLAAAYARAGQYDRALSVADRAHALALRRGAVPLARSIAARQALYRAGAPYQDTGPAELPAGSDKP